jgi:hypothetical protein
MDSSMGRLLRLDWDVVAGIVAAVAAIVLHLLHVAELGVLLTILLVLMAVLLLRSLRGEHRADLLTDAVSRTEGFMQDVKAALNPPEVILIGPRQLRKESERFAREARGEMIWFNVCCLMFRHQEVFDTLLGPAIANPAVTAIQFISNAGEHALWATMMMPKIRQCAGHAKVREPRWVSLPETLSFILADINPEGRAEALVSFWGEPFMARTTEQQDPRYVFRVQGHSELIARLIELERQHRMAG